MAPPVHLTKGTIENVPIPVNDELGNLLTLDGKDLRYDLYIVDEEETDVSLNVACANDEMTALPLIDTTNLDEGKYAIFITFVVSPQTVRMGPFEFWVDD